MPPSSSCIPPLPCDSHSPTMMLFLLKALISVLALLAACVVLPQLPLAVLRIVLRGVGWIIQRRTRSRREYILSRVRADEEEFQSKRSKPSPGEDEDWEKVDTSSSSSGPAGNNSSSGNDDWEGIIGFFHPFWYVVTLTGSIITTTSLETDQIAATLAEAENVSSGKPSAQHRSGGPRPSAPSILATMRSAKPPCWRECR